MSKKFNEVKDEHLNTRQIADIQAAIKNQAYDTAGKLLTDLITSGQFINLWAAFEPEHDFVETYQYKVLTEAATPLRSLIMQIPDHEGGSLSVDLIDRLRSNEEAANKFACFDAFFRRR